MIKKQIILGVVGLSIGLILTGCAWYNGGYGSHYYNYGYRGHYQGGHEWGEHGEHHEGGEQHYR